VTLKSGSEVIESGTIR